MENPVTIQEYSHKTIRMGSYCSTALCVLLFLLFLNSSAPFWTGIFRLSAFIFFSLAVLGYLNMMNGPLKITLNITEEHLLITYQKKGSKIQEEQFERDTIKKVTPKTEENVIYSILRPQAMTFKIHFTDTNRILNMFEFGGRPLFFEPSAQQSIKDFLEENEIPYSA